MRNFGLGICLADSDSNRYLGSHCCTGTCNSKSFHKSRKQFLAVQTRKTTAIRAAARCRIIVHIYTMSAILIGLIALSGGMMIWQVSAIPEGVQQLSPASQQLYNKADWVLTASVGALLRDVAGLVGQRN